MKSPKIIKIDNVEYIRVDEHSEPQTLTDYVIVRSASAGVFFGKLTLTTLAEGWVKMENARRLWMWVGASSLSQLAVDGPQSPNECKFPVAVPEITILGVIEIIPVTSQAAKVINSVKIWKQ